MKTHLFEVCPSLASIFCASRRVLFLNASTDASASRFMMWCWMWLLLSTPWSASVSKLTISVECWVVVVGWLLLVWLLG